MINQNLLIAGDDGYNISRSLRFRSSASAYLSRTPASAGNRKTWTWSGWVKRGSLGSNQSLIGHIDNSAYPQHYIRFDSDNTITFTREVNASPSLVAQIKTTQVFRDISSWYHIVIVWDTTQATADNRMKLYVNGNQITSFSARTNPVLNSDGDINNTIPTGIGAVIPYSTAVNIFDGYLTEINFIDGQALTPSSFGETDAQTGVWKPKKYAGTYGTNGFYLPFSDNSSTTTLGYDKSGNSNNWTTNNISLTAGVTYDSMTDVPTLTSATAANYCVLNPLNTDSNITVRDGNLFATWTGSANKDTLATIAPTSGKFYCEVYQSAGATADVVTGFCLVTYNRNAFNMVGDSSAQYLGYTYAGRKWDKGAQTNGLTTLSVSADYLCFAIDYDAGKAWAGKNGVWFASGDPATGANPFWTFTANSQYTFGSPIFNGSFSVNFGQRPFSYTPPTGFLALNTFNLPEPSIKQGNKHFDVSLWTGNGSTLSVTNSGSFAPDFVWTKSRSNALNHNLFNIIQGTGKGLVSNSTAAEFSDADALQAFNSNGFSVGPSAHVNTSGYTYVGWQWKANGSAVSNTAGSITSTVSANPTAGFSVVTYTGTGANATVGHGLGVAPKMIITKSRSASQDWGVYHTSIGATGAIKLNTTGALFTDATMWNNTSPTSSVFSLGSGAISNTNAVTHVAYCFAEVAGYSKFGSYTGNGSTDGTFVALPFKPKFVMVKRTDSTSNWSVLDGIRDSNSNPTDNTLYANLSNAEDANAGDTKADFLSNGFKIRASATAMNASGGTYIYMAFAEVPQKFALGV